MIGYAFCGSFCTLKDSIAALERLANSGYEIQPIMSETLKQDGIASGDKICSSPFFTRLTKEPKSFENL